MPAQCRDFPPSRHLAGTLYVLALLSIAIFCYERSLAFFVLAAVVAGVAWIMVEPPVNRPAPRWLINAVLIAAAGYLAAEIRESYINESVVIALDRFVASVLLCKLFETKADRDLVQIALLSLIIAVAAMMFSPSGIGFALLAAAFSVVLTYAAILLGAERSARAGARISVFGAGSDSRGASRRIVADLRGSLKPAFLLMVPVALVLFILLPRTGPTGFVSPWTGRSIETGFTENVQFRDFEQLTQSDDIVMQVRITQGRDGPNMGSAFYQPYFRGQVLDLDRRFSHASPERGPRYQTVRINQNVFQVVPAPKSDGGFVVEDYTVYLPPRSLLFAAGSPAYVQSDQFSAVWFNAENGTLYHSDGASPLRYTVFSPTQSDSSSANDLEAPPLPEANPTPVDAEVVSLAHKIVPGLPTDAPVPADRVLDVASSFESYLRNNYPYSLSTHQVDAKLDPIADFLLNHGRDKQNIGGYCEYFAAGFVMLCHAVGIDARMVTGYYGGEFNSVGGYYVVRQKDAHAWAEYFVPGQGWMRSDPTASDELPDVAASFLTRWMREIFQVGENGWLSMVVTFDNDSRRRMFGWLADISTGPTTRALIENWWPFALEEVALTLVAAGAVRFFFHRRKIRRRHSQAPVVTAGREVVFPAEAAFLFDLLGCMSRLSPRRRDLTPSEFASSLPLGPVRDDVRWLIDTAYAILWGGTAPGEPLRAQIAAAMDRIQHQFPPANQTPSP